MFLKDNLDEFKELLKNSDCIVGYNNHRFDNRLLIANGLTLPVGKSYDILEEIWKGLGLSMNYRWETHGGLSLDEFGYANFKSAKPAAARPRRLTGRKADAGSVIDYCLSDVEITRRLAPTNYQHRQSETSENRHRNQNPQTIAGGELND